MKKNKNLLVSLLTLTLTFSSPVFASDGEIEEVKPTEILKNYSGVGISAGYLSSLGFSYRNYFADKFGYKISGIAFFDQYQAFGTVGLQGMYVFSENDWLRFYGLLGVSSFTTRRVNNYSVLPTYQPNENDYVYIPPKNSQFDIYNNIGTGIGIELGRQSQGLSLAVELPITVSFKGTTLNFVYPIPQISLIYNF